MKRYKVLVANKGYMVIGLARALEFAQRESRVGNRVSVFDGNTKVATYQYGDKIAW